MMQKSVIIDCFVDEVPPALRDHVIVAVDVIRTSTTAITGLMLGRDCYPVPSIEAALPLAARLDRPILVGELGGNMPYGFDLNNSPAQLLHRTDVDRPMILLTTSGTRLIHEASAFNEVHVACLRNESAEAAQLIESCERVALVGAGTRGEFREEDQICCARIAEKLMDAGFVPEGETQALVERWANEPLDAITRGKSAQFLRDTRQEADLEFVLTHVDDVAQTFRLQGERIAPVHARATTS